MMVTVTYEFTNKEAFYRVCKEIEKRYPTKYIHGLISYWAFDKSEPLQWEVESISWKNIQWLKKMLKRDYVECTGHIYIEVR
jgi:hypothetical protein